MIPFLFGMQIDLLAVIVFILTMILFVEIVKWIIRFIVCKIIENKFLHDAYKLDWLEDLIETDEFKLIVSFVCGFGCFWALAKYGNLLPITDGTRIEISALTFLQFSIFVVLTCGGYRLLKPVIVLWLETLKNKIFKKGE
jgi:hypothetical protein